MGIGRAVKDLPILVARYDPVSLLLDLLEAGAERLPAKPVRERFPGPLSYLERIGAVQADALLTELTCAKCDLDHSAVVEFDPVGREYQYFCPEVGLVTVDGDHLKSLRVDPGWLLDCLERGLSIVPPQHRRTLIGGRAWLLGEAIVESTSLTIALVIGRLAFGAQNVLASTLARIRPIELGIVLATSADLSSEALSPPRYDLLDIRDIIRAETDRLVFDRAKFIARVKQLKESAVERTQGRAGRPSTIEQTLELFHDRRARKIPFLNKSAEAREIRADWSARFPQDKAPVFSTIRSHLPKPIQ
jgi:hypothetical protein